MANTCSFKINNGNKYVDHQCFLPLINKPTDGILYIEENKFYFNKSQIRTYLNDLKLMGFNFTYRYMPKLKRFELYLGNMGHKRIITAFCMAVRYLWEGRYKGDQCYGYDKFYKVIEHYFKLKELYPKKKRFRLLCYACNCFLAEGNKINSNHFFSYSDGCKLRDNINELTSDRSVNDQFNYSYIFEDSYKNLTVNNWTKETYDKFIKKLYEK